MDDPIVKLIYSLGSGGIAALILYFVLKKTDERAAKERAAVEQARLEALTQQNARIAALEIHVKTCDEDRTKLWGELVKAVSTKSSSS